MEIKLDNVSYYDHEILRGDCLNSPHKVTKHIDNCSLTIAPGTIVGIIGSSLETRILLKVISLRSLNGQIVGHIQHDNSIRKFNQTCYRDIAFIPSTISTPGSTASISHHCQYFHYLTITSYLLWSIQLRINLSTTSEYYNRVREVCNLLDLNGSLFIHELEDGQLFLLSLATELVTNPTLICIESPIDSLDEYTSCVIIQTLMKISHRYNTSTTIIFTALAPSSTIYSYLDQIILFYNTKILYSSKNFFEKDFIGRPTQLQSRGFHHPSPHSPSASASASPSASPFAVPSTSASSPSPSLSLISPGNALLHPLQALQNESIHATFEYCHQTFELISREFMRCGYGTKLFYLSPELLKMISKDVDILHFLVADPYRSNTLLENFINRVYSHEMQRKREKLEQIIQRYIQMIVTRCIEHQNEQRNHDQNVNEESVLADTPRTPTKPNLVSSSSAATQSPSPQSPTSMKSSTQTRQRRLPPSMIVKSSNPFLYEVQILTQRAWASATTNHTSVTVTICQYLISGILLGLFAYKSGKKSSYTNDDTITTDDDTWINDDSFSITSTLFFLLIIQIYIHIYTVPYHISHLKLLKSEIASSIYHPLSAYTTLQLFHWSIHFIGSIIITSLIYLMLKLSFSSTTHLFYYYITILLYIYTSLSLLTALCLYLPSQSSSSMATYCYLLISTCILLLSGYIQPLSNLSYPIRVLTRLSYGRYTFQLLMILCYGDTTSGKWYLERYSFENTSEEAIINCILCIFFWFLALQVAIIWGLYPYQSRVLYTQALGYFGSDGLPRSSSSSGGAGVGRGGAGSGGGDHGISHSNTATSRHSHQLLQNDHSMQNDKYAVDTTYHPHSSPTTSSSPAATAAAAAASQVINQSSNPTGFQAVLHSVTVIPLDPSKRTSIQFRNINFYLKSVASSSSSFYFSTTPSSTTAQSLALLKQTLPTFSRWNNSPPIDVTNDPNYELLLKNLSGECNPYQLWCVLDSEDDTTTLTVLLQLLGGISKSYGVTTGHVTINGVVEMIQDTQQPYDNIAYVCKGDSPNHRYLTVREVIYYQILLRRRNQRTGEGFIRYAEMCFQKPRQHDSLPSSNDPYLLEEIALNDQVDSIIRLFQLEEICEVSILVGDSSNPHISPSQLRCLTIAMESIHTPGIYLLQDPFEGLDWYHTERVLRVLRGLVDGGRCIICAISNPTERMLCYFNRLMLLHKGLLLYSGEMTEVKNHFNNIGYQPQPQQTLLDYLYDVCHGRALLTSLAPYAQQQNQQNQQQNPLSSSDGVTRKRAPSSLLTPEDLANIRHSMDGYTSPIASTSVRNTISSRRSHSSTGPNLLPTDRFTSTSSSIDGFDPHYQFVIEDTTITSEGMGTGVDDLEDIPVPYGPVVIRCVPLVLPSARVTLYRRCVSAFRNRRMIALYWIRSFLMSIILGLLWFDTDATDVQAKLMLATTAYLYIVGCLADLFEGTHRRQADYLRERVSVAQTAQAYWWSDGTPVLVHSMMNAILLTTPLYLLSGSRTGSGHFICYAFLLYCAVYCNVGLMYLVSALTRRPSMSRMVYLGLLLPLQLLFCGSLIYLSTYPPWLRWGAYLNPMHYFLAAIFINEFRDNSSTFPSSATHHYNDLKSQYGYHTSLFQSIFLIIVMGYFYKMLWLFSLKYRELWTVGTLPLKKAFRAAKKKMKKLMKAGLRFSKRSERGVENEEGYVLDNSTESYDDEEEEEDEEGEEGEREGEKEGRDGAQKRGNKMKKKRTMSGQEGKKKRKSLNEEMYVREDGLLLFGVMQPSQQPHVHQQQQQQQPHSHSHSQSSSHSHHSVLSALYRPEYIQSSPSHATSTNPNTPSPSPSSLSISSPPSAHGTTGGTTISPNQINRNTATQSKNRIVVSKSQRGGGGGGGLGGASIGTTGGTGTGGGTQETETLHSSLRI